MKAADELDQEGQTPTLARIRKKLGDGGRRKPVPPPLTNRPRRLSPTDWPLSGMISGHWRWKSLTPALPVNGKRWRNHARKQKKRDLRPRRWLTS
ncbi:hypothetical protein FPE53_21975 [Salmonella enterica subsp. enterica]|nr:hypothetical protein [Salmonella enterica subsp. enterica serovar Aqua]